MREREEGAGLELRHIWKEGCARRTSGGHGRGGGRAPVREGACGGDFLAPAPLHERGGMDGELGEGNPSCSNGRHPRRSLEED